MAISRYIYLKADKINQNNFLLHLPDIDKKINIPLTNSSLEYQSKRDYLRSGYNQFIRRGIQFNKGYEITITGDIPINAGAASSSALVVAWLSFLNRISNNPFGPYELAIMSYNTEVREFGEAGGMMDFFSSLYGNVIYLESKRDKPMIKSYEHGLRGFVLGDSLQKKNTVKDLKKVKETTINAFSILKKCMPNFNRYSTKIKEVQEYLPSIEKEYRKKIVGNLINRDLTKKAKELLDNWSNKLKQAFPLREINSFYERLGSLINKHQEQLRTKIEISTEKIDQMIASCREAGALGAKINGSGFGGTMFAFGIKKQKKLMKVIKKSGGVPYNISTSSGVEKF